MVGREAILDFTKTFIKQKRDAKCGTSLNLNKTQTQGY